MDRNGSYEVTVIKPPREAKRNGCNYQKTVGFLGDSDGKESTCNAGDLGSIPGLGRPPGGGYRNPLRYSCLENPHGQRSLTGHSPWGHKESDTTERLTHTLRLVTLALLVAQTVKNLPTVWETWVQSLGWEDALEEGMATHSMFLPENSPTTEDEMVGWHHRRDGHEFEQAPGDGDGQGGLACCSPWGCKESNETEQLN